MSTSPAPLLQAPRLTGIEQSRPRLGMARGTGITEVWASAGTGKTTLLALWAEELRAGGETAAWIRLPSPGQPRPRLAALARTSLATSRRAAARAGGLGSGRADRRATLLIDDIHHLTSPEEGRWLADLIESPRRDMRIVLAGRHPPRPLAGCLAQRPSRTGRTEYGTGDLAFTGPETAVFLAARGIRLAPPDVDALQQLTGGWAAALALLAGLAGSTGTAGTDIWNGTPDAARVPLGFEAGHRAAADYLNDPLTPKEREILRELPRYQTVRSIAARQRLSPNTVKTHIRSLYQKLGVSSRAAAVDKALEKGLL